MKWMTTWLAFLISELPYVWLKGLHVPVAISDEENMRRASGVLFKPLLRSRGSHDPILPLFFQRRRI